MNSSTCCNADQDDVEVAPVREIMTNENIQIDFDVPTDLELAELAACIGLEDEDEEDPFEPI